MVEDLAAARRAPAAGPSPLSLWTREFAATWSLGLPLALSQLAWMGLHVTDVVVLGWYSPHALAASGLGANYFVIPYIFGMGLVGAVSPIVAQIEGARAPGRVREVRRAVRQGLWVSIALAVPAILFCLLSGPVFRAMGQDPGLVDGATDYVLAAMPGLLPAYGMVALRSFMTALSRARPVLLISLAALPINLGLDLLLVFGHWGLPELGVAGAGLASAAVELAIFCAFSAMVLLDRRFRRYGIFARFWRADWSRFLEIWRVGLPIGGSLLLEVGVFSAGAFLVGYFGAAPLAAHQIAIQCAGVTFMVPFGIAQATTVRVGLFAGRQDATGARRAGLTGTISALAFMSLTAILFWTLGRQIAALFVDMADPGAREVAAIAAAYLAVAAVFQLADGAQVAANGALRGLKDTAVPMVIVAIGYWLVAFPLAVALGFGLDWQGEGVWWGLAAGLAVAAVALTLRFLWRVRRLASAWA